MLCAVSCVLASTRIATVAPLVRFTRRWGSVRSLEAALALTHLLCSFLSNLRSITTRGPVLKMGWNSLRMGHTGRRRQQQPRTFETSSSPELINEVVAVIGRVYYANGQVRVGFIRWVVRSFVRRGTRMAITSHNNNKWSSSSRLRGGAEAELRFL